MIMVAHGGYWFSKATTVILIPLALTILLFPASASAAIHTVGGSIWSIPPSKNFYINWTSSQKFIQGDFLYFDFESEMYNVHHVDATDYGYCESDHPENIYEEGPVLVPLEEVRVYKFICFMLDYCSKGLKFSIYVQRPTDSTPPAALP